MKRPAPTRGANDGGAVLIFTALAMTAILLLAALVLDIGLQRISARKAQTVADLAALAGGRNLGAGEGLLACIDIVNYLNINTTDMAAIDAPALCTQPGNDMTKTMCDPPYTAPQAAPTITSGRYTISIHYPVPDDEIRDPKYLGVGRNDGSPCERMRVIISTRNDTIFAGIADIASLTTTRSATVRGFAGLQHDVPALWLLDPHGCTSLVVSGGSQLSLGATAPTLVPGVVAIDSDGTACSSNQVTVSVSGSGTNLTAIPPSGAKPGKIALRALDPSASTCSAPACDSADVLGGRLSPQPIGVALRATRAPIDWRYNCKSSYPTFHGIKIPACTKPTPSYLDNLITAVGSSGNPNSTIFQRWSSSYSCNPSGTVVAAGNWWIDCNSSLAIGTGTSVTFTGGNLVFDKGIKMTGGELKINTDNPTSTLPSVCTAPIVTVPCLANSSSGAGFVYLRDGDIDTTGGTLTINHTVLYQRDGALKVAGGVPPNWSAPTQGPFAGLSYWSEEPSNGYQINGGAGVSLNGIFFTPEAAPFSLSGGGDWGQQHAQFVSFQLAVSGGAHANLTPDPTTAVLLPPINGTLIR